MIKISGCSDDLVEIEGDVHEELNVSTPIDLLIGESEAAQGVDAAGVVVRVAYAPDDCGAVWTLRVAQIDEDIQIPWKIAVSSEDYSAVAEIDCPPGTRVRWRAIHDAAPPGPWRPLREPADAEETE